ncbi:MAG: tetratricopeptide repeat protein [Ignavibacterium sp.]|jgi:tetratricopeptide (TPR) repeat protein|nr:tetratricopeptide repeat protein [Ignavibacterium sp.]
MKKVFLFILLFSFSTFAQNSDFDSRVNSGIKQIYNIKFTEAEKTFRSVMADYPEHPAGRFFIAMIDWWKILLDPDNESYDEIFFQKLEDVIYQCDQLLDKNPKNVDALFFKGGSIGFRGRLRAFRESWLKAADDGREALPIVEEAASLDPNNMDVQLGFGIYNYYAGVIPNEYPMIKPLMIFFPDGDKEKGIEQLKNTAFNGKFAKYEARYFLMTLYYRYENNSIIADEYAKLLNDDFPDNPVFEKWRGRIAVRRGDNFLADSVFRNVLVKADKKYIGYDRPNSLREAAYYVGNNFKNSGQLDSAKVYFERCIVESKKIDEEGEESGFQVNSVLYLAQIAEMQNKKDEAIRLYEKLLDMNDYGRSHLIAENSLKKLKVKN